LGTGVKGEALDPDATGRGLPPHARVSPGLGPKPRHHRRYWPTRKAANGSIMIQAGKGADAAVDIILSFGAGKISQAILPMPGTTGLPRRLARHHRGGR